ncbi:energy transducer TonB [Luteimonas sp. XNQY3]|nr:energy transducer TonB [Luteimonas sp. XNQY3]MCD9005384.1 energy transducer TonB [Luteimonas sp. XNQY3]
MRDGRPMDVRLHRSSGHRELDRAAMRHVQRHWTFQPAMRDGVAVEAIGLVPIAFDLSRG